METIFKVRKELLRGYVPAVADRQRVHVLFEIFIIAETQKLSQLMAQALGWFLLSSN